MSIQIQKRSKRRPTTLAGWLALMAPQGLNTNAQFFLVFLGVVVLHLVLTPVFMRAAGTPEPGEPQGYLTTVQEVTSSASSEAPPAESSHPEPPLVDETEIASVTAEPAASQASKDKDEMPPLSTESASTVGVEEKTIAPPAIPAVSAAPEAIKTELPKPSEGPKLSDLIATPIEPAAATKSPAPEAPPVSSPPQQATKETSVPKPVGTPEANDAGVRQFRNLP